MRVLSVVGNRPQFVKSAPLSVALRGAGIDEVLLHTGQHYDRELSAVFFRSLACPGRRTRSSTHGGRRSGAATIEDAIASEAPAVVLVYGDTNSTLAGARAGVERDVPVAHVEAGLRSGDLTMPEERNGSRSTASRRCCSRPTNARAGRWPRRVSRDAPRSSAT